MSFASITGHDQTKLLLQNYLATNKVPHALMFSGPEGIGKSMLALEFAKALNCQDTTQAQKPCDVCPACAKIAGGFHPDVFWVKPSGKSNIISIEQIRELKHNLHLTSFLSARKICLINDAHTMNEEAANALLKVLEEPPEASNILIITDQPYNLLDTIKSRCHKLNCHPVPTPLIEKYLDLHFDIPTQDAASIATFASGSIGKAVTLANDSGIYEMDVEIAQLLVDSKKDSTLELFEKIRVITDFFAEMEKNLTDELKNEAAEQLAKQTSPDPKLKKEMEKQATSKVSSLVLGEVEKLVNFSAFLLRDVFLATHGYNHLIANNRHMELILKAASKHSPEQIMAKIDRIDSLRKQLSFNMGAADFVRLFFLRTAR